MDSIKEKKTSSLACCVQISLGAEVPPGSKSNIISKHFWFFHVKFWWKMSLEKLFLRLLRLLFLYWQQRNRKRLKNDTQNRAHIGITFFLVNLSNFNGVVKVSIRTKAIISFVVVSILNWVQKICFVGKGLNHHDEHLFIIVHQTFELWFKQVECFVSSSFTFFFIHTHKFVFFIHASSDFWMTQLMNLFDEKVLFELDWVREALMEMVYQGTNSPTFKYTSHSSYSSFVLPFSFHHTWYSTQTQTRIFIFSISLHSCQNSILWKCCSRTRT